MRPTATRAFLFLLTVFGGYALYGFNFGNDFFEILRRFIDQKQLPNDGIPNEYTSLTGLKYFDDLLSNFVLFFWPCVNGDHPDISLFGMLFIGQSVAAWTLTMLEGMRTGNAGQLISL